VKKEKKYLGPPLGKAIPNTVSKVTNEGEEKNMFFLLPVTPAK